MEEDGIYIPENMSISHEVHHVFAMNNWDWRKNTLEGGSFNTTSAIITENSEDSKHQAKPNISLLNLKEEQYLMSMIQLIPPVIFLLLRDRNPDHLLVLQMFRHYILFYLTTLRKTC